MFRSQKEVSEINQKYFFDTYQNCFVFFFLYYFIDVCNLRLDFEKFDLLAGSGSTDLDSECRDKFEVSNLSTGNFRIPTICGFNTGEHSKLFDFSLCNSNQ